MYDLVNEGTKVNIVNQSIKAGWNNNKLYIEVHILPDYVTSSEEKIGKSLALGADHAINYKTENIKERILEITNGKGADLVVDSTGALFFEDAYASLARGGRFGICGVTAGYQSQIHLGQLFSKQLKLFGTFMGSMEELKNIVHEASKGNISTHIHKLIGLEELKDAHEEMEKSEHFGKFIVSIN